MNRHLVVIAATVVFITAAIAWAQIAIWPLPLRLPKTDQWWFWVFVLLPLIVFPLNAMPQLAAPLLFLFGAAGLGAMIVRLHPDVIRCIVAIGGFLGMFLIIEPRLVAGCLTLLRRLFGARKRPGRKGPPTEFSPALVPRGPKNPAPLVAYAQATHQRDRG